MEKNNVAVLKADKTEPAPEVDKLLVELGNTAKAIPFVAIYPGDGSPPILLDALITQGEVMEALKKAGPSVTKSSVLTTAMNPTAD